MKRVLSKALVVTTVASTIDQFCKNDLKLLAKLQYEIDIVANFSSGNNVSMARIQSFKNELLENGHCIYDVSFSRSPLALVNFKAYKKLKSLISRNRYSLIHCHTPIAAAITRVIVSTMKLDYTTVIYTAHGFHFFSGAPLKNWLLYYPIERWLARYTDILITINREDYTRAGGFKQKDLKYIPGVGLETQKFREVICDRGAKRKTLKIPQDAFVVLSVGELNKNKNHEVIIKALKCINNRNVIYVICGQGVLESYLLKLVKKLDLEEQVKLLGFREDIAEICKIADVFAFPSRREGLGIAALEAMATGLPLITSNVHGIVDYSKNGVTGYSCAPDDVNGFARAIDTLLHYPELCRTMGNNNIEMAKQFDLKNVAKSMMEIYKNCEMCINV